MTETLAELIYGDDDYCEGVGPCEGIFEVVGIVEEG